MGIFKRGGIYWMEFVFHGQRVRGSTGTADPQEARQAEANHRERLRRQSMYGDEPTLPKMTLDEAIVRYDAEVLKAKRHLLAKSHQATLDRLRQLREEFGGDTQLSRITSDAIAAYRGTLLKTRKPATVNRQLSVLNAILRRAAHEWGALTAAPRIRPLEVHDERTRVLSDDEEKRLLDAAGAELRDFLTFLIDSGARRAEALSITWDDVHLEGDHASVTLRTRKTRRVLRRPIPLTKRLTKILTRRRDARIERPWPWSLETGMTPRSRKGAKGARAVPAGAHDRGIYKRKLADGSAVFDIRLRVKGKLQYLGTCETIDEARAVRRKAVQREFGDIADSASLDQQWKRAVTLAGVTDLRLHDLRHTFASRLARKGVSLTVIGDLLGHSNPLLTKRYAHLQPSNLQHAIHLLD